MKKILHITECLGSGVLNYIKNISTWQAAEYDVYVAYATRPETPENFREQFNSKIHFIFVEGFTREIEPNNDLRAFFNIKRIVRRIRPDLIHLHSTKAGVIGRWAINCNKFKVLYSPHAYSFLMMNCSKTKRNMYKLIEKISDKKKCLTITDIDGELEASRQVTKHAICIANGINPDEMDTVITNAQKYRCKKKKNKPVITMLGKIVEQKNPYLFNELASEFKDINFVWIGSGPLKNVLDSPNVTITGWLSREEAIARIMDSDIFLFPSAWESLSIALMEVMYIGKPCIVSDADGNKDVIRNGKNGIVCKCKSEYINAINELLLDSNKAIAYGKEARQDIINKYNVYSMENEYKKLFLDIHLNY